MSSGSLSLRSVSHLWCLQACTGCGCLSEVAVPFPLDVGAAQIIHDDLIASSFNSVTKSTKTFVLIREHVQCWDMATCSWCQQLTCGTWTLRSHLHGGWEHFQPVSPQADLRIQTLLSDKCRGVCLWSRLGFPQGSWGGTPLFCPLQTFPLFSLKFVLLKQRSLA